MKLLTCLLALLIPTLAVAQAPKRSDVYKQAEAMVAANPQRAAQIYTWLLYTPEIKIHQMRGATENKVYLMKDGHSEGVYDAAGKLVKDGYNDGSYNKYLHSDPLNHFLGDMLPWIVWGATKADPTTRSERIEAYTGDLRSGLNTYGAVERKTVHPKSFSKPEKAAVAMFLNAIEAGGAHEIHAYLADPSRRISNDEWNVIAPKLQAGLKISLKDAETFLNPKGPPLNLP